MSQPTTTGQKKLSLQLRMRPKNNHKERILKEEGIVTFHVIKILRYFVL
jgi:hypothetical protein